MEKFLKNNDNAYIIMLFKINFTVTESQYKMENTNKEL